MKRPLTRCVVALLAALLTAATVGRFCVGRYAVATHSMQPALIPGDRIVVDKLSGRRAIRRGTIVLFRSPRTHHDAGTLLLGRCVGLPGDTITVTPDGYLIHSCLYPSPIDTPAVYRVPHDLRLSLLTLLCFLDIPVRHLTDDDAHFRLHLTPSEVLRVRELLPLMLLPVPSPDRPMPRVDFTLPTIRRCYDIDSVTLRIFREALLRETNGQATIRDGKLYIDSRPTDCYLFREEYYWILADNADAAVDSRHFGPIPRTAIVGTVIGVTNGK